MSKSNLYKALAGVVLAAGTVIISCNKQLDKTDPSHPTLETYFKTSSELLGGTNAIYSIFHSGSLVGREWFFVHDLRSDDVASGGGQLEPPRAQLLNGATSSDNTLVKDVWNGLYTIIHRSNTVIDNGPNVTDNTELRDRCVGEAKFFRAWAYFELVSMWGPVPIYTKQVTAPDQFQPRKSEEEVYTQIITDLTEAVAALPATTEDLGRATKGAANAMLGRVHMQKGDYAAAKTALQAVISSGLYSLVPNYSYNFDEEHEFNAESIFEAVFFDRGDNNFNWGYTGDDQPNAQPQSTVRNQEYSPIAWRNLIPSNRLLNEYEVTGVGGATKSDPRFGMTVYQTGDRYFNNTLTLTDAAQNGNASVVNGVTKKISWRKFMLIYKDNSTFRPGGINQRIIRYADILLMMAECEAELGSAQSVVTGYLNQVRDRPGVAMPHYPTAKYPCNSKAELIRAIMHERTAELGDEEVRNRDILRWRKKGYYTTDPLPYFRANRDELLPIPQTEIDNNPELGAGGIARQNQGY